MIYMTERNHNVARITIRGQRRKEDPELVHPSPDTPSEFFFSSPNLLTMLLQNISPASSRRMMQTGIYSFLCHIQCALSPTHDTAFELHMMTATTTVRARQTPLRERYWDHQCRRYNSSYVLPAFPGNFISNNLSMGSGQTSICK